mgnify:CR=1 FL=1
MKNKSVFITGGSSGIGLETAKIFAQNDFDVWTVSINREENEEAVEILHKINPFVKISAETYDLSSEKERQEAINWVKDKAGTPDVIINNAGYGVYGNLWETNPEKEKSMLNLLILAVSDICRAFLPAMIARNSGTVINIASIAAFQPNPGLACYGASKAFVYQYTRALREELKDFKSDVRAICICPTPVKTNFQKASDMEKSPLFDSWMAVTPDLVAREIYRAYRKDIGFLVPGRFYHYISALMRVMPEWLSVMIGKKYL